MINGIKQNNSKDLRKSQLEDFLGKVEDLKEGYIDSLTGVLNYTDNGGEIIINKSYFGNAEKVTQKEIEEFTNKIDEKINRNKKLREEIDKLTLISEKEREFLKRTIDSIGLSFLLIKTSIYLEAEKGGFKLDVRKRKKLIRKVNTLQDLLYGREIGKSHKEKKEVVDTFWKILNVNKKKLNTEEEKKFERFLKKFGDNNDEEEIKEKDELEKIMLSAQEVKEIMDLVIELYGIAKWECVIKEGAGNFSVKYDKKIIVAPNKPTNLMRLCQLIDHEIGVHLIRGVNTEKTLKVSGNNYLEGEEGMATLGEKLMRQKIEDIYLEPTNHHLTTFIAENNDAVKTEELLRIYFKLTKPAGTTEEEINKDARDRTKRVKRYVSNKKPGANRKDTTYTRGQNQVKAIFDSGNISEFLKKFYFSKLSLDDLEIVDELKESLGIEEKDLKFPMWIGKIIYKRLKGENAELEDLLKDDMRFEIVKLENETKRKVEYILGILERKIVH